MKRPFWAGGVHGPAFSPAPAGVNSAAFTTLLTSALRNAGAPAVDRGDLAGPPDDDRMLMASDPPPPPQGGDSQELWGFGGLQSGSPQLPASGKPARSFRLALIGCGTIPPLLGFVVLISSDVLKARGFVSFTCHFEKQSRVFLQCKKGACLTQRRPHPSRPPDERQTEVLRACALSTVTYYQLV